jgi:hypothetical protein
LLDQLKLSGDCEVICRWIRVKECVLRCIEICGAPPAEPLTVAEIPRFANAIAKITGDEELIERLADAILERDNSGFQSLVRDVGIGPLCHLLCYWACVVYSRLICEVICAPRPVQRRHLVSELGLAGAAVGELVKDRAKLDQVIKAGVAANCEVLSGLLGPGANCVLICEWICSWHCVLVCLLLCRRFPLPTDTSIEEERAFAQAVARLAGTEGALARLVEAVSAGNAETYGALIREFKLQPFCAQLCHWICFGICRLFCICVCPPPAVIPMFTKVGQYRVDPIWGDFTADGTTTAGGYAFTSNIPLIGIIPNGDAPTALQYRFLVEKYPLGGGPAPLTAAMIPPTIIGQLEYWRWNGLAWVPASANYWANNPDPGTNTISIPQQFGPPLVVPVNKAVAADGWIDVPRENALVFGGVGLFVGGADNVLAELDTTKLTSEAFDLTPAVPPLPLQAGDPVPAAQQSERPHFKIYFEARNAVTLAPVSGNNLDKIALSNTAYTYIRHTDWAGGTVTTTPVVSLDIAELKAGGGCNPLAGHIHTLFTAYHPYLATCSVYVQGPGVPPPAAVNPAIDASGQAISPAGGQDFDISTLKPCAYVMWITTTLNLTQGYGKLSGEFDDLIAFCIH